MRGNVGVGILMLAVLSAPSARGAPMDDDNTPSSRTMPIEGVVTHPDWTNKPSGEEMANYYPYIGQVLSLDGRVALTCVVTSTGALDACAVASESPPGVGFGPAALRMAPLFKMKPETLDGAPVGGAKVTIPLHFAPPETPPPTAPSEPPATAPEPGTLALAHRLAAETNSDAGVATYLKALRDNLAQAGPTPQASLALDDLEAAYKASIPAQIDHYAQVYARSLSEPQLAQIVAFLESPAGRAWTAQTAQLRSGNMAYGQSLNQTVTAEARARFCGQIGCPSSPAHSQPAAGKTP